MRCVTNPNTALPDRTKEGISSNRLQQFLKDLGPGIITGAADKGTWVRIHEPVAEGRVIRGFEGLDVGDRVRVELVHTDANRGFIDFARSR